MTKLVLTFPSKNETIKYLPLHYLAAHVGNNVNILVKLFTRINNNFKVLYCINKENKYNVSKFYTKY